MKLLLATLALAGIAYGDGLNTTGHIARDTTNHVGFANVQAVLPLNKDFSLEGTVDANNKPYPNLFSIGFREYGIDNNKLYTGKGIAWHEHPSWVAPYFSVGYNGKLGIEYQIIPTEHVKDMQHRIRLHVNF
ncbi:MAG: hypothetical protein V1725_08160 [archaeon]